MKKYKLIKNDLKYHFKHYGWDLNYRAYLSFVESEQDLLKAILELKLILKIDKSKGILICKNKI